MLDVSHATVCASPTFQTEEAFGAVTGGAYTSYSCGCVEPEVVAGAREKRGAGDAETKGVVRRKAVRRNVRMMLGKVRADIFGFFNVVRADVDGRRALLTGGNARHYSRGFGVAVVVDGCTRQRMEGECVYVREWPGSAEFKDGTSSEKRAHAGEATY